jgi:hypothetical protein
MDTVRPQNLARLDEVVALIVASEGETGVLRRVGDGTLAQAVEKLSPEAMEIARSERALEPAFRWESLAGDLVPKVVEHEVFRRNKAEEFTRASLRRILSLDDRLAISRLATLKSSEREPLLELPDGELKRIARALDEADLASLSRYMTALERNAGQRLLQAVALTPSKMMLIGSPTVRDAIIASRDQAAAVGMMLRADGIFDVGVFFEDLAKVRGGAVSPWVLWARYPNMLTAVLVGGLILLLVLWRLLFGRRRSRIVVEGSRHG